jgi:hypothetical protein
MILTKVRTALYVISAVLCVTPSFAQVSMTLTGAGSNGVLGNVYIGPYVATIGGVKNVQAICDDFVHDTFLQESWTANVSSLPNTQQYEQAAWLTLQLLNSTSAPCNGGTNCAGDIQYALWQLMDPTAPQGQLTPFDYLNSKGLTADLGSAQTFLTNSGLSANYSGIDYSRFSLYTPIVNNPSYPITCTPSPCASAPPQNFIVVRTPEPPSLAILGLDLSALGALVFFLKRRLTI